MATHYEVKQKIIPFAYPQVHLLSSVTIITDGNENDEETVHVKRDIADWASITPESIGPTIAYAIGLCKTIENNAWDGEDNDTVEGELWAYITPDANLQGADMNIYHLEFALCKDSMEVRKIRDTMEEKIQSTGIKKNIWVFKYGDGLKKPILDMLYDKRHYIINIKDKITNTVSYEEFPEHDIYDCIITEAVKPNGGI